MRNSLGIPCAIGFCLRLLLPTSPAGLRFNTSYPLPLCSLSTHHCLPDYRQTHGPDLPIHNTDHTEKPTGWCSFSPHLVLPTTRQLPAIGRYLLHPQCPGQGCLPTHASNLAAPAVGSFLQEGPCTSSAPQTKNEGTTVCVAAPRH